MERREGANLATRVPKAAVAEIVDGVEIGEAYGCLSFGETAAVAADDEIAIRDLGESKWRRRFAYLFGEKERGGS